ncbi:Protein of unknown function [Pseudomonas sp. ok272]|uniref:DUF1120 domain-containing protein n=1 Tax=unclassified Pseudomonas TaxID=196821 RepID=UPI0008BA993E|nr:MULTISPECIES: DUF1120 domain-containing protein [unclassified Pseudomonas]SEM32259.1 Protein of unknown function [Pseudomonas sp. ok272]SFM32194.1 Protein of unknown function [Pseudomonas sp. ok602]
MNTFSHFLATLVLTLLAPHLLAASETQLSATGNITPSACLIGLSANGVIDHGRIPASSLKRDEFTVMPGQLMVLEVNCSAPLLFTLVGLDGREDSSLAPDFFYGLGKNPHAPDERLGSVALSFRNPLGDGQPMLSLTTYNNGTSWSPEPNIYPRHWMGFARPGRPLPEPIIHLVTTLRVDTSISPANNLSLKQEVPLDGAIVLDLRYL